MACITHTATSTFIIHFCLRFSPLLLRFFPFSIIISSIIILFYIFFSPLARFCFETILCVCVCAFLYVHMPFVEQFQTVFNTEYDCDIFQRRERKNEATNNIAINMCEQLKTYAVHWQIQIMPKRQLKMPFIIEIAGDVKSRLPHFEISKSVEIHKMCRIFVVGIFPPAPGIHWLFAQFRPCKCVSDGLKQRQQPKATEAVPLW